MDQKQAQRRIVSRETKKGGALRPRPERSVETNASLSEPR